MHLVPFSERQKVPVKLSLGSGLSSFSSTSMASPGTGMMWMPVHAWVSGSAVASCAVRNGTTGTVFFIMRSSIGGVQEVDFWAKPGDFTANKRLSIETNAGIGVHEFHVWAIAVRSGVGQDGLVT